MKKLLVAGALLMGLATTTLAAPAHAQTAAPAQAGVRMLMTIEIPNDTGNAAIRNGSMAKMMPIMMNELKPEALYFATQNGHRCMYVVFTMHNSNELPLDAEPAFLGLKAKITVQPCMNLTDLMQGLKMLQNAPSVPGAKH